jgi:hypothetical protein
MPPTPNIPLKLQRLGSAARHAPVMAAPILLIQGKRTSGRRPWALVGLWLALAGLTLTEGRSAVSDPQQPAVGKPSQNVAPSIKDDWNRDSPYTVHGRLEMHWLTLEAMQAGEFSPVRHVDEYAFTVSSDGPRWSMSIRPIRVKQPDPADAAPRYQFSPSGPTRIDRVSSIRPLPPNKAILAASDGTEFSVATVRPPSELLDQPPAQASRGPGSEPFNVWQPITAIWYTYASHSALSKLHDPMLVPMEHFSAFRPGRPPDRVQGWFTLAVTPPHLPEQIIIHGYELFGLLLDADTALTNSLLRVNVHTNVHDLAIPLETTIEHHTVSLQRGRITSHPQILLRLHTLSVEPTADLGEYPPLITGPYRVEDYRLRWLVTRHTTDGWDSAGARRPPRAPPPVFLEIPGSRSAARSLSPDATAPDPRSPFQMRLVEEAAAVDTEALTLVHPARNRQEALEEVLHVRRALLVDHTAIASATVQKDPFGNPVIEILFTDTGAQRFATITRENIGRQLPIIVAGRLLTAPRINTEITGGRAMISGSFSEEDAAELADKINAAVKASIDPRFAVAPTTEATHPHPSGGVMGALLTPEELGQGWSRSIDILIDPASQPAEILRGSDQMNAQIREAAEKGSALGLANVRYARPDHTGFEVWAYRFADSDTVRRHRSALLTWDIQHHSRVIEGLDALVFEGGAHQGPMVWLLHKTFVLAVSVAPGRFPEALMPVLSQFALKLQNIPESP